MFGLLLLVRSVLYQANYDPRTGYVDATATILLANTAPASGLPDYMIGNDDVNTGNLAGQPRGSNHLWLSVYSPLSRPTMTIGGKPVPIEVESELGYHVYSTFVLVPAGQQVSVRIHYSGLVKRSSTYKLVVANQPLVNPDLMRVVVKSATPKAVIDEKQIKVHDGAVDVGMALVHTRSVQVPFRAR